MQRGRLNLFSALGGALLLLPFVVLCFKFIGDSSLHRFSAKSMLAQATGTSFLVLVGTAFFSVSVSLPLAWFLHATNVPGKRLFSVLIVLPLAFPSYVGGYLVVSAFSPGGLLPLFDPYSIWGAYCALSFTFPLAYLSIRASLQRIDQSQWHAARSLGLSGWQSFKNVVWPQIKPGVFSGGLWVGLYSLGDFGAVSLTRTKTLSYMIYLRYKSLVDKNEAVVYALVLLLLSLLICWLSQKGAPQKGKSLRTSKANWVPLELGASTWPVLALFTSVTAIWLVAPCCLLVAWIVRGSHVGASFYFSWPETLRTLGLGAGAALLIVSACVVMTSEKIGRVVMPRRTSNVTGLVSALGYSLPGIVIGLTCASAAIKWLPFVYQTVTLLVLGLFIRFSPLALDTLSSALRGQCESSYWAARSLGNGRSSAIIKVVLPSMKGSLWVSLLALFVAVIKELPVTMMLAPPGFSTLSTKIWSLTEDAYLAEVAPIVFTLVGFTVVLLWAQMYSESRGAS